VTTGFVADSSVGVAWAVTSQSSTSTDRLLDEVAEGTPFSVPLLWMFEVANALVVLARRKRMEPEAALRARRALSRLPPLVDEEGPRAAWTSISDLAEQYGLSVYDATYLELALRKRLPLASRDAGLNRAAKLAGVKTM
jgi:predicted nucleic acid-binding protein